MDTLNNMVTGSMLRDEAMTRHTSYGIGGPAKAYITPKDKDDLAQILQFSNQHNIPTYFVGSGSNLLVADEGIDGLVITLGKSFNHLDINGETVFAESGVMLGKMVKECIRRHLSGVESLIGVPGTLGGALVMNAGAFGGEISNYLKHVTVMTMAGDEKQYVPGEIEFSYRHSTFPSDEIVVSAEFKLIQSDETTVMERRAVASAGRKTTQPLKFRSAGSVFKNPKEGAAGYYIDQAGLKGTKVGDAEISDHHANFFVNHGQAKAEDIVSLIKLSRQRVYEEFGIMLELEVKTLGFSPGTFDI
tara:strand:- start:2587 stop:3495 length:909 start_codon:yes stop_codon:yes gene_type:complete